MSLSAQTTNGKEALLARLYAPVAPEMERIEQLLQSEMRNRHAEVDELVRYGVRLGGKRMRPALVLLAGKATGQVDQGHEVLGAVVEMIHTATLVHDDVLDDADTRRQLPTVNTRWDNATSVLLGDYLFSHAFYLASTLDSTYPCRLIGQATNVVCEGEMRQKQSRGDFGLDEDRYLQIIEAKTAALCQCSTHLGAHRSGADEQTQYRLAEFGRLLGVSFQIVDDILDLIGADDVVGKTLGTDLEQNILTLPLIHCLQQLSDSRREQLIAALSGNQDNSRELLHLAFAETDALDYAFQVARRYAAEAKSQLDDLPDSPARDALVEMTEFVVARSH